jgi:D-xylonolactonase
MTVDAEGYVWLAQWDGSCLIRLNPEGEEVERVRFPAKKVSSIIFGGDDYRDAYVTTANVNGREVEGEGAGALFRVDLGVAGKPEFFSGIGL